MIFFLRGCKQAVELLLPRGIVEIDNKSCSYERHRFMKKICQLMKL